MAPNADDSAVPLGLEDDFDLSLLGDADVGTDFATSGAMAGGLPAAVTSQSFVPGDSSSAWDFHGLDTTSQPYNFGNEMSSQNVLPRTFGNETFMMPDAIWRQAERLAGPGDTSSSFHPFQGPNGRDPAELQMMQQLLSQPPTSYVSPDSTSTSNSPAKVLKRSKSASSDLSESQSISTRKRKSAEVEDEEFEEDEEGRPVKKTAHNEIEKRYRNNINDKISELRDAVPSLRIMYKSSRGEDTTKDREELEGLAPAHKLNKGTVLSKATEYINHLKKRNHRLAEENKAMRAKLATFEKIYLSGAMNGNGFPELMKQAQGTVPVSRDGKPNYSTSPTATMQNRPAPPAGMIEVPQDMKRIISASSAYGQPYPVPQQPYRAAPSNATYQMVQSRPQQPQQQPGRHSIPYLGKLMVGSLAGIMILQSTRESETSNETPDGRGLFSIPTDLLASFASSLDLHFMEFHLLKSFKFLLLFGILLYIWVPSLFDTARPKPKVDIMALRAAPSMASSIQTRRQAWLTAVQTVWVPRHNFILEALALVLKMIKITVRNAIGIHGFQLLTGLTEEQEKARVKAWSIALDSQLAGGDVEINFSRLMLTLLASYTLPESPIRLMMRALHFRVLFWNFAPSGLMSFAFNALSSKLARSCWTEARQLNQLLSQLDRKTSIEQENALPEHLALLVEQDCDVALSRDVVQRACNLAFNLDTTHNVEAPIDGMDAVVEDCAIGSPMDAAAAWWSTELLHHVLMGTLFRSQHALTTRAEEIQLATNVAPIGSVAQVRGIVAQAVLIDKDRKKHINTALETFNPKQTETLLNDSISTFHPISSAQNSDLKHCVRCAVALAYLQRPGDASGVSWKARQVIDSIRIPRNLLDMSLLGFTSTMELVEELSGNKDSMQSVGPSVERLTGGLRRWMGDVPGDRSGVGPVVRLKVVERCLAILKSLVCMDVDQGYGSMSERDGVEL